MVFTFSQDRYTILKYIFSAKYTGPYFCVFIILCMVPLQLLTYFNSNFSFQTYAADVFFSQEWKDHRLILPDNMTREYRLLPVEWLHMIWRPDSFFKNAKKVTFQTMTIPNHYVWLYKDKTILYMVK